ncbi:hypothetical protein JOQ06_015481, partial [Pogonophryne albipinna]
AVALAKRGNLERHHASTHVQFDESTDATDTAQLGVFVRMVFTDFTVKEAFLALIPLKERTRGEDVYKAFKDYVREYKIPIHKIVSFTTDGAPAMLGVRSGFVALCRKDPDFPPFIVNSIRAKALQHRLFKSLLDELDSVYGDLILHADVRWLSRGKVLQRFLDLLPEIISFLKSRNEEYEQLSDDTWLLDLGFLTDLTAKLNDLNRELQGKDRELGQFMVNDIVMCSPYKEEITLGILQLQESNRLEILKRRWWEGGQCPKEEDHRVKVCQEMLSEFRSTVSFKKSSRSRRRRPLSSAGGGILRHPSRLALATPRPIRLVREMRLSNGKLYRGGPGSLGGSLGGGSDLGPGPQRLLEDPLGTNTSTPPPPPPPPVSALVAPPAPLRSFLSGCSHVRVCQECRRIQSLRSALPPPPSTCSRIPPSHHLRHNAHPHLHYHHGSMSLPRLPPLPPPIPADRADSDGGPQEANTNPPPPPRPLPLPKTPMCPPTDLLMGHN